MRHKSTVYNLEQHNPFEESKDELKMMKNAGKMNQKKDEKEGQSEYRKKLATRKK